MGLDKKVNQASEPKLQKAQPREYDLQFVEGQRGVEPYWRVTKLGNLTKHRPERIRVIEYSAYQALQEKLDVVIEAMRDAYTCESALGAPAHIEGIRKILREALAKIEGRG